MYFSIGSGKKHAQFGILQKKISRYQKIFEIVSYYELISKVTKEKCLLGQMFLNQFDQLVFFNRFGDIIVATIF